MTHTSIPSPEQEAGLVERAALLPCPFCGSEPASGFFGDEDGGYWGIDCTQCACAYSHADSEIEALAAWNRRATLSDASLRPMVDELVGALTKARDQFRFYAAEHVRKAEDAYCNAPDDEAAEATRPFREKAATNQRFADICDAIITRASSSRAGWRPIAEHDGSARDVIGMDERGIIERTWFYAPSSRTRDWLRCRDNKPWHPTHFMPLPSAPTPGEVG